MCEELIASGISIVAATGNDEHGAIKPPANALNVIAVGGLMMRASLTEAINHIIPPMEKHQMT